jgi:hypothetical protein
VAKCGFRLVVVLALGGFSLAGLPQAPAGASASELAAAAPACNHIQVVSRDRAVLLGSYVVSDPDYVQKMRALIDANGENGAWTVSAGDLGALGYTVTYSCLP